MDCWVQDWDLVDYNNISPQQQLYHVLKSNMSGTETIERINILIKDGVDIHKPLTNKGEYVFHAIIGRIFNYNDIDIEIICDYLLQHNCDINALNNDKETPFYTLCNGVTKNYKEKNRIIQYLLESGAILDYSEQFGEMDLLRKLNDETQHGYDIYLDLFNAKLDTFLIEYSYIIDYCLFSSTVSFKYILRNRILDFEHLLLKYAEHKIFEYTDEEYFYDDKKFDYISTFWYLINEETMTYDFKKDTKLKALDDKRNKIIFKYLQDSLNYWSPSRHYIHPTCVRNAVWCILLIQHKINQVEEHPLFLPPEMLLHICSFFTREMWIGITKKTIPIQKFTRIPNLPCLL